MEYMLVAGVAASVVAAALGTAVLVRIDRLEKSLRVPTRKRGRWSALHGQGRVINLPPRRGT